MAKYVIEREIPGLGTWSQDQLREASQTSCGVLNELGPDIRWLQSYATADKLYCVYESTTEKLIREHSERSGFPANSIQEVTSIIGPFTAAEKKS